MNRIRIWPLAIAPLMAGCSIFASNNASPQAALDENRQLWQNMGINAYTVRFQNVCIFCATEFIIPVRLTIRDGVIEEVRDADTDDVITDPLNVYLTVEEIFDQIQSAIDSQADDIDVRYDEEFGYPTDVDIDQNRRFIDDQIGYLLREFASIN